MLNLKIQDSMSELLKQKLNAKAHKGAKPSQLQRARNTTLPLLEGEGLSHSTGLTRAIPRLILQSTHIALETEHCFNSQRNPHLGLTTGFWVSS
jgi:hypothetical protein